jgi:hypothetical protein
MVSIVAFQAVDPGSIPGPRSFYFYREIGTLAGRTLLIFNLSPYELGHDVAIWGVQGCQKT